MPVAERRYAAGRRVSSLDLEDTTRHDTLDLSGGNDAVSYIHTFGAENASERREHNDTVSFIPEAQTTLANVPQKVARTAFA